MMILGQHYLILYLDNFDESYEDKFKSIFDHWTKLYIGLNAQPEIQILNELGTVNP